MKTYSFYGKTNTDNTIICLGDFDGIHKGHRTVFENAKNHGEWGVLLFSNNSKGETSILTLSEKVEIIKSLGAKYVITADFEKEIKNMSPKEFIEVLAMMRISGVSVGYDYRFGKGAKGDTEVLKKVCKRNEIDVYIVDAVLNEDGPIKSTKIRELIKAGNLREANSLLGSPYLISGSVSKGLKNGTKIGFPTANIDVPKEKLLPPDGVYEGIAMGRKAVINIGKNPTLDAKKRTVEVHILDFNDNLYGEIITVKFLNKIRDEIKFDSLDELKEQIKKDIIVAKGEK